ncbi:MAG TPA: TlyA family RNA methyltransferase [Acidimicrobiales bacterium]|nr:TlyA family RNA methyltransferase [Acidimicrobiales bacterium]
MAAQRRRLDLELVRRGITESRQQARHLIDAGRVLVGGATAEKAGRLVAPGEPVQVLGPPPRFVGRGGEKLAAALERFAIDPRGARALDAGSSTGGFTDALLQEGATSVVAVDVGRAQLHERLRADPRVDVREQTDIRDLDPGSVGGALDVVVADLSFISLRGVAPVLLSLLAPGGDLVVLVKPQFEAGRAEVSRGRGVIRDPEVWRGALDSVATAFADAGGAIMEAMVSPLRGADGNVEFLVHVRRAPDTTSARGIDVDALVAEAVAGGPT